MSELRTNHGDSPEVQIAKEIIRSGWDDHMWNFENMDVDDEKWLLVWAGHDENRVSEDDRIMALLREPKADAS